jgi:hypothetical protein
MIVCPWPFRTCQSHQVTQRAAEVAKETYVRNRSHNIAWYAGVALALGSHELFQYLRTVSLQI